MGTSLTIRHKRLASSAHPYRLDVRSHTLAETDYTFVCGLDAEAAAAVLRTRSVRFLHGTPPEVAALLDGSEGRLVVSWDRETTDEKDFVLAAVDAVGGRVPLARLAFDMADTVVDTADAHWERGHPLNDPDYLRDLDWRRARALRAEAERLERRAGR